MRMLKLFVSGAFLVFFSNAFMSNKGSRVPASFHVPIHRIIRMKPDPLDVGAFKDIEQVQHHASSPLTDETYDIDETRVDRSTTSNLSDSMKERLLMEASNTCGCSGTKSPKTSRKRKIIPTQLSVVTFVGILFILVAVEEGMLNRPESVSSVGRYMPTARKQTVVKLVPEIDAK